MTGSLRLKTGHESKSKVVWRKLRDVPGTLWFRLVTTFSDDVQALRNSRFRYNGGAAWMTLKNTKQEAV
jgi:hypothetical protein